MHELAPARGAHAGARPPGRRACRRASTAPPTRPRRAAWRATSRWSCRPRCCSSMRRRRVRRLLRIAPGRSDRRRRRLRPAGRRCTAGRADRARDAALTSHCDEDDSMSDKHLGRGDTAVITGAASGFGLELARLCAQRGMNIVAADVQADALARAEQEFDGARRAGAAVQARRVACRRGRGDGGGDAAALRRAAPGLQQRRRRRRRPDLGAHAGRLGMGARRQRDGRRARRARVHAADARGRRARPRLRRARRSTRRRWPGW